MRDRSRHIIIKGDTFKMTDINKFNVNNDRDYRNKYSNV